MPGLQDKMLGVGRWAQVLAGFGLLLTVGCGQDPEPEGKDGELSDDGGGDGGDGSVDSGGADGADGADGSDGADGADGAGPVDADEDGSLSDVDCDDANPAVFPGAVEVCNDVDDDCDGDEDESDAEDAIEFYLDLDGDGFGGGDVYRACSPPAEAVYVAGDCDDGDLAIRPDAVEVCGDGIDNDCDSASTACETTAAEALVARYGEGASANAAQTFGSAGDVNNDGLADLIVGAPGTSVDAVSEGVAYILPSAVGSSGGLHEGAWRILGEEDGGSVGKAVLGLGDIDGDGFGDALVGGFQVDVGRFVNAGRVWLVRGGGLPAGGGDVGVSALPDSIDGGANYGWFGGGLASAGDLDNDGLDDVLVGATGDRTTAAAAGAVSLITGATLAALDGAVPAATAARTKWVGENTLDYLGARLAGPGDLDGDGIDDLALAADNCNTLGSQYGRVYLFWGPVDAGVVPVASADVMLDGLAAGDRAGGALAPAGDADGDGYRDLWASVTRDDYTFEDGGAVFLVAGGTELAGLSGPLREMARMRINSPGTGQIFGQSLSGARDWDGDGENDLLVGVPQYGASEEGAAYLFTGPFGADLDAATDRRALIAGDGVSDHLGSAVALLPDVLSAGRVAIGLGTFEDDGGGNDAGALFLFQDLGE